MSSRRTSIVITRLLTLVVLLLAGFYSWISATEFMEDIGPCLFHVSIGTICLGLFFVLITRWGRQEQCEAEDRHLTMEARQSDGHGFFHPHPSLMVVPLTANPDNEGDEE